MAPTTKTRDYVIEQRDGQWCLLTADRDRVLGCHDSKEDAEAQERAVQSAKAARAATVEADALHLIEAGVPLDAARAEAASWRSYSQDLYEITGVEVFATGKHNGDPYTARDLDDMVRAFDKVGFTPPVKRGHDKDPGAPAYGWVNRLYRAGQKLLADIRDVPKEIYEAIKRRQYGPISAEIYWDFERGNTVFPRVLKALALLGADIPAVSGLKPIYENVHGVRWQTVKSYKTEMRMPPELKEKVLTVTVEQMRSVCRPCAEKMRALGFAAIKLYSIDGGKTYVFPGGMPEEAFRGLCETFGPDEGFRTRCMDSSAAAEVDDAGAFCNALESACIEHGLLSERRRAKALVEHEIVENEDGKFCVKVDGESRGCFDTREEAEAKLKEASMDKDTTIEGLQAKVKELTEKLAAASGDEVKQLKADLTEARTRVTTLEEKGRQERIAGKAAKVVIPRFRRFITPLYDALTAPSVPKTVKFAREDGKGAEDKTVEDVLDALVADLNAQAEHLFGERSVAMLREGYVDPQDEVDRRTRAWMREKSIKDYGEAMAAVLDADEDLKQRYAGVRQ